MAKPGASEVTKPAKPSQPTKKVPASRGPKAEPSPKKGRPDWEAIERDYRTTHLSAAEIAAKHGNTVTPQGINKRARTNGWQRDLTDAVRRATKAKVIQAEVEARIQPAVSGEVSKAVSGSFQATTDAVLLAAEIGAEVVMRHRDDARKARGVAMSLLAELETATMGGEALRNLLELCTAGQDADPDALADARAAFDKLLGLNSRVGAAQKLADAMTKLQMLERKAFDLDAEGDKGKPQGGTAKYHIDDDELAAIASGSSR